MADPVVEFFKALDQDDADVLATKVPGVVRVDLDGDGETDHWVVTVAHRCIKVSREFRDADLVLHSRLSLFQGLIDGRVNLFAALLRREFTVEGNLRLLTPIERVLPSPQGARDPRDIVREKRASGR